MKEQEGLDALLELPDTGLYDDSDPESSVIPSEERIVPKEWAKKGCRYCHGKGEVQLVGAKKEMQLCRCVQIRVAKRLGKRR